MILAVLGIDVLVGAHCAVHPCEPACVDAVCQRADPVARHHHPRQLDRRRASPRLPPRRRHLDPSISATDPLPLACLRAGVAV